MTQYTFPKNFIWGAATSAHQVEGNNIRNDWWQWEEAGRVSYRSGAACEHYTRFEADFDIAQSLGHNAHRFSIEWSRIEPRRGVFNEQEITHYRRVIEALRARRLEPIISLHHFTNPQWIVQEGGWENPQIVSYFVRYVEMVVRSLGENVRWWLTFCEPIVFLYQGYVSGKWPPGERSTEKAMKVYENLVVAHAKVYQAIKSIQPNAQVGLAHNAIVFEPCRRSSVRDRISTWMRQFFFNHLFLRALTSGFLFFPGVFFRRLPAARTLDFIGLNYYWRDFVHFAGWRFSQLFGRACTMEHHRDAGPRNSLDREIYPQGLFQLLMELKRYRLPILITENGVCTEDDRVRWEYIHSHLTAVRDAMEKGVPVIGYLYWSLLDNFEWHEGTAPRFGLVEVDYATQERRIRPSARQFARVCQTGAL